MNLFSENRQPQWTLNILKWKWKGFNPQPFGLDSLTLVYKPFWEYLPHANVFKGITPDILHQLHNMVFKNHLIKWIAEFISADEFDEQYWCMSTHLELCHLKNGISGVRQWMGTEVKEMEKVIVGVIAGAGDALHTPEVLQAVKSLITFIYFVSPLVLLYNGIVTLWPITGSASSPH